LRKTLIELNQQKFALDQHSCVSLADKNWKINYVNDKILEMTQYSREELLGKAWNEMAGGNNEEDFKKQANQIKDVVESGQVWKGEITRWKKGGQPLWVQATVIPFMERSYRSPTRFATSGTDISEQIKAEKEVK